MLPNRGRRSELRSKPLCACYGYSHRTAFRLPLILKRPEQAPEGPLTTLVNGRAVYEVRGGTKGLTQNLNFTVAVPKATFEVANLSTRPVTFTLEATSHKSLNQDGKEVMITNEDGDTPLNWIGVQLWDGEEQVVEKAGGSWKTLEFTIPPEDSRQFILTDGDDVDLREGKVF
jgi:hypothetical protein